LVSLHATATPWSNQRAIVGNVMKRHWLVSWLEPLFELKLNIHAPCARHASLCPRGLGLGVCSSFAPAALALVSSANWKFNWAPFFIK
jgi:hypothetical protein